MRTKTRASRTILSILAAIALISAGAAGLSAQARKSSKDTLVLANRDDVGTLAPYADTSTQGGRVRMQVYETLFTMENDGSYAPCLATEWDWDDDLHLTIKLRKGVKFHNGRDFKADDVVFTLQYAKKSRIGQRFAKFDVDNSRIIDDYTVQLAFAKADGLAMALLGSQSPIMDKETVEAKPDDLAATPIGTGPYKFVKWITGDSVTLVRNDLYWGRDKAIIKNLIFRNVAEITQRSIELQTGGVDFVFDLAATAVPNFQKDPGKYTVYIQPSTMINGIYMNMTNGRVFANEDLRKAVALAIKAQDIIKGAYDGNGNPPAGFVSRSAPGIDPAIAGKNFWPHDLEKAKEYFAKSGVAKGTKVNVIIDGNAFRIATCEIIKNELAQIGLDLNIQQYDFGTTIGIALNPSKDWDMFLLGSGEATAVGQTAWYNGSTGFVTYPLINAEFKALVEKELSTTDPKAQAVLCKQIQNEVNDHVVMIPVQEDRIIYAHGAKLQGVDAASVWQGMILRCKDLYFK